jgi:probable phosphomutase (TIGR03848 family)
VQLDDVGRAQAAGLPERLARVPLAALVTSPLERCRETLAPLAAARPGVPVHTEERITECEYGEWTGRTLAELAEEPLMATVQQHPAAAVFPGGESMPGMQARAVAAVRAWDARVAAEHGPDACYLMCSHGDVVKSVVADALGMHLDLFQRIAVGPCSLTVVRYTPLRPFLLRLGDTGELDSLAPAEHADAAPGADTGPPPDGAAADPAGRSNAAVGGGA